MIKRQVRPGISTASIFEHKHDKQKQFLFAQERESLPLSKFWSKYEIYIFTLLDHVDDLKDMEYLTCIFRSKK